MSKKSPRWQSAINSALEKYEKSVVIQLASIDATSPIPHVRSHIFRSFLDPRSNPALPLILTTTDVRSPKTAQIIANPHVNIAWWIEGTQEQFRISGVGSIIPSPQDPLYKQFIYSTTSSAISSPNTGMAALSRENFDWEAKRKEVFKTMSAHMKASWCRPTPGSPLIGGQEEAKTWPERVDEPKDSDESDESEEEKKNRKNWDVALRNFALILVDPTEVDYVELGVFPNRRTLFNKSTQGLWKEQELVP
ncbi:pyridoxamine 5 -phosphate oxidase- fmn-binding [Lentinula edodes]|uniref:Pyridoxamine 5-phosphate oxidase-fmn-binding n=1 Tax=Lentinula edodes TaxID=5353 RepID=A0A1Q3E990_LENED|nr:uncharacterized protein C8R40DRAFT_1108753 [Lentinula edodes]KAH7874411.1 hypothetical protein C8R40DRAFT_1108753 [Lentinula edodes]KAJ3918060.1 hypothetical protein F5877DRAFT_43328 [Lentinula edodes]GAW03746.1 pyridoxamine 5 -phosphate oxidase- fmn-binding [Lentinula edodes]